MTKLKSGERTLYGPSAKENVRVRSVSDQRVLLLVRDRGAEGGQYLTIKQARELAKALMCVAAIADLKQEEPRHE